MRSARSPATCASTSWWTCPTGWWAPSFRKRSSTDRVPGTARRCLAHTRGRERSVCARHPAGARHVSVTHSELMPPQTRYARSGDLNIAYQVVGDGPGDLVYVPGWISNVELNWDEPSH